MDKIGITITMCNEVDYTRRCVESIKTSTPYVLILIDDFSIDGTKKWINSLFEEDLDSCMEVVPVIDPDTNSLGQKWNLGATIAKKAGCSAVLTCNNDILFHPNTIDAVVARLDKAREAGENVVLVTACNKRGETTPEGIFTFPIPEPSSEAESPDFSCFLLDLDAWEKVGKFSEDYKPCYFEDNDFHTMLKIHNLKAINITDAPYYHYGSITQNQVPGGICKPPQFEHNRHLYIKKFGAKPDEINLAELRRTFLK